MGVCVMATLASLWCVLAWLRTPWPGELLERARDPGGTCFDCPLFLLFGRGFGGTSVLDGLLALASLPAVLVAMRTAPRATVRELSPIVFFGALLVQSLAMGLVGGVVRWLWRRRRARARVD